MNSYYNIAIISIKRLTQWLEIFTSYYVVDDSRGKVLSLTKGKWTIEAHFLSLAHYSIIKENYVLLMVYLTLQYWASSQETFDQKTWMNYLRDFVNFDQPLKTPEWTKTVCWTHSKVFFTKKTFSDVNFCQIFAFRGQFFSKNPKKSFLSLYWANRSLIWSKIKFPGKF